MNKLIEALKQIEQMSDPGSYEVALWKCKSIATDAIKEYQPSSEDKEIMAKELENIRQCEKSLIEQLLHYKKEIERLKKD